MSNTLEQKLPWALLTLRVGIFIVMFVWAVDKLVNPGHAAAIFEGFYGIGGLSTTLATVLGSLQILLCLAFVVGAWKTVTYGLILVMHAVSTLSSFPQYMDAFNNLLFFAAWPMLAACIALFMLREYDTKLSF
ncbi:MULTISPECIES: hypothetical protein [unclassified Idiomarina]|jgi:hypothetical protein|uniref:hypothetical protein n=1 Tax=unclassified Idiomarina TaxID=2614829 RepID=UPI00257C8A2D|nr:MULTISPECIES: hypothetical protein [unclassified Idiomarina]|tara:strand:+ start:1919 stop:2317 length:399 start_codon:yes stop_codon:yes gene_type:complete